MAEYRKSEAREWAKAKMRGVANVIEFVLRQAQGERGIIGDSKVWSVRPELVEG